MGGESKGARATQTAGRDGLWPMAEAKQLEVWKIFENGVVTNFNPPMNLPTFEKSHCDVRCRYDTCITPGFMADLRTVQFLLLESQDIVAQRSSI